MFNVCMECDNCHKLIMTKVFDKQKANFTVSKNGCFAYRGGHLCPDCNTEENRKKIRKGKR